MSDNRCRRCGRPVSSQAASCSSCRTRAEPRKKIGLRIGSLLVLGLLFVVGVSTSSTFKTKPTGGSPTQSQPGSGPEANQHAAASTPAVASPGTITRSELLAKTKITDFTWHKEPFDTLTRTTFTIHNDADVPVRDIEIKCTHSAPNGSVVDHSTRTFFAIIRPHSTRTFTTFTYFDVGFVQSQTPSSCEVTDLAVDSSSLLP